MDPRTIILSLSPRCRSALEAAVKDALSRGQYEVTSEHLLYALLDRSEALTELRATLLQAIEAQQRGNDGKPILARRLLELLQGAWISSGRGAVQRGVLLSLMTSEPGKHFDSEPLVELLATADSAALTRALPARDKPATPPPRPSEPPTAEATAQAEADAELSRRALAAGDPREALHHIATAIALDTTKPDWLGVLEATVAGSANRQQLIESVALIEPELLLRRLSHTCQVALQAAVACCGDNGHYKITVEHLLLELSGDPRSECSAVMAHYGLQRQRLAQELRRTMGAFRTGCRGKPGFSPTLLSWLLHSWIMGLLAHRFHRIRSSMLIMALAQRLHKYTAAPISTQLERIDVAEVRAGLEHIIAGVEESQSPASWPE